MKFISTDDKFEVSFDIKNRKEKTLTIRNADQQQISQSSESNQDGNREENSGTRPRNRR